MVWEEEENRWQGGNVNNMERNEGGKKEIKQGSWSNKINRHGIFVNISSNKLRYNNKNK
jgi:hypothetical protein